MSAEYQYQLGFSEAHAAAMYDQAHRQVKANKSLTILEDHLGDLSELSLLDIGCSTGFMTRLYAQKFANVLAMDIDEPALVFASENNGAHNIEYHVGDSMNTGLPDGSFDVATCTHIYEHVPDAQRLLDEVYRVLKPNGVCLFAAANRFVPVEPHYKLPLLSVIPKSMAHLYLRIARKGTHYYENLYSLPRLKRLVARFEVVDYTVRVIESPERFSAIDVVQPGSRKQRIAVWVARHAYPLVPAYLWILRKPA